MIRHPWIFTIVVISITVGPTADEPNRTVDWSASRMVDPSPADNGWHLAIHANENGPSGKPITLPATSAISEKAKGSAISATGTHAAIGYISKKPGNKNVGTSRMILCKLVQGKTASTATMQGELAPIAINDD